MIGDPKASSKTAMRDDFTEHTKRTLAHRAGYRCSNPKCGVSTAGPGAGPDTTINLGVAAHITAASPGGPRYDPSIPPGKRRSLENGIWLCQNCAKLVDSDSAAFDRGTLERWKRLAEANARARLGSVVTSVDPTQQNLSEEEFEIIGAASGSGDIFVVSSDQTGQFVRAGSRNFWDEVDASVSEVYLEALHRLQDRQLARHEAGIRYRLTGTGFRIAQLLMAMPSGRGEGV